MRLNYKNIFIVILVILSVTISSYVIYKKFTSISKEFENIKEANNDLDKLYEAFTNEEESTEEEQIISEDLLTDTTLHFSAWIPYWDFSKACESYKASSSKIETLSPTWYYLQADGSLGLKNTARDNTLRQLCRENNTRLIPTISNSNAEDLSKILNNNDLLEKHVNAVVNEVIAYQYDGIDIDYEFIKETDRDSFSNFINLLSLKLHENNKLLTIAVLWKNEYDIIIENFSSSRAAQDWETLGKYVDEFRVMAYDFTSSSDSSGPIAPINWIRDILDYSLSKVPDYKIILGLPLYAYEWTGENNGAKALVWTDVQSKKNNKVYFIIQDILDQEYFEKKLTYTENNLNKIIWYQDMEATQKRIELTQTFGINKFIFWRLGGEDSEIWNLKE